MGFTKAPVPLAGTYGLPLVSGCFSLLPNCALRVRDEYAGAVEAARKTPGS